MNVLVQILLNILIFLIAQDNVYQSRTQILNYLKLLYTIHQPHYIIVTVNSISVFVADHYCNIQQEKKN